MITLYLSTTSDDLWETSSTSIEQLRAAKPGEVIDSRD